jgi:hypothetical protein
MHIKKEPVMQNQRYTEKDWKLFRSKISKWQSDYMDKLEKEYIELLKQDGSPADKFWELEKRIKADKKRVCVVAKMSRSLLLDNILSLILEGAITLEDLNEFSDELKETMQFLYERYYE